MGMLDPYEGAECYASKIFSYSSQRAFSTQCIHAVLNW